MSEPIGDPQLTWTEDAQPRSGRFGDVYFSAEDGLAESRAVFLQGCGLPHAWRGRRHFTIGELGFGSGLNIAALIDLWRRERDAHAHLHVFTVEAFPMHRDDAARALAHWPELAEITKVMHARLPPRTPGFHRLDFPEWNVTLDLAYLEVEAALVAWDGHADAWFLDGFSPATNPGMWCEEVLALVAQHSAPGARAATFTVASAVRRGLAAQGFTPEKRPGFGRKRERLEATFIGEATLQRAIQSAAIIGGGIAGASLARALKQLGVAVTLVERDSPGAGASGAPAALVTPRFDAAGGAVAQLFAQAFERATAIYSRETPDAILARGLLQLEHQDRDAARFDKVAAQALWDDGAITRRDASASSTQLEEPIARGGMSLRDALAIDPAAVLHSWLDGVTHLRADASSIAPHGDAWRVADRDGATLVETDAVFVTAGWDSASLLSDLPLAPVRGQVTLAHGVTTPATFAWGGYAAPTREGYLIGATHDRGDADPAPRDGDDARNLESLGRVAPQLAARASVAARSHWSAVRAITPDRLPLAGELAPGLFILGGLGARGFTLAPLLAEHLAALPVGAPSPLPHGLGTLVTPARYRN